MPYVLSAVRDIKGMQMKYIPGAAHRIPLEPDPSEGTEAATACIRYHAGDITPDTDVVMVRIPQSAPTCASNEGTEVVPRIFFRPRWISFHGLP